MLAHQLTTGIPGCAGKISLVFSCIVNGAYGRHTKPTYGMSHSTVIAALDAATSEEGAELVVLRPGVTSELDVFATTVRKPSVVQSLGLVVETVDETAGGWSVVDSVKEGGLAYNAGTSTSVFFPLDAAAGTIPISTTVTNDGSLWMRANIGLKESDRILVINGTPTDGLDHDLILEQFTTQKLLHLIVLRAREKVGNTSVMEEDYNPDPEELDETG